MMTRSSSAEKIEKKVENKENQNSANATAQPVDPNDLGSWGDKIPKSLEVPSRNVPAAAVKSSKEAPSSPVPALNL